jgi:hypothetical protein
MNSKAHLMWKDSGPVSGQVSMQKKYSLQNRGPSEKRPEAGIGKRRASGPLGPYLCKTNMPTGTMATMYQ